MSRSTLRRGLLATSLVAAAALGAVGGHADATGPAAQTRATFAAATPRPLAGVVIALDPGHQLGNRNFPRQIHAQVPAGGFRKDCNTVGASTNAGVPEPTVNWRIAQLTRARLQALGATVRETRTSNRADRWGPCVDQRARFAARVGARVLVSIHADGARAQDHGFHVIVPVRRAGPTLRTAAPSLALAKDLRAGLVKHGFARSSYIGHGTALSVRSDLATLNLSTVPVAMIEVGNMRNSHDAALMTRSAGQARYAASIVAGIRAYLHE